MARGGGKGFTATGGGGTTTARFLPFLGDGFFGGGSGSGGCRSSVPLLNARPIGSNCVGSPRDRGARTVSSVGEFDSITVQRLGPSRGMISIRQSPLAM